MRIALLHIFLPYKDLLWVEPGFFSNFQPNLEITLPIKFCLNGASR